MKEKRGKFIVFEGPDGGGKTYHLDRACQTLQEMHEQWWVRSSAFRDHRNAAAQLRLIREDVHIGNPRAELLMVLAALESTWTDVVNTALDQGYNVLMDRWLISRRDMPESLKLRSSSCISCKTGSGSAAGPAL